MMSHFMCYIVHTQMVVYEAARAMVNIDNVTARELQPAVSGKSSLFVTSY